MTIEVNMASNRDNCNIFHGFSEEEIDAAFENSSWSERNGLICSLSGPQQNPSLEFAATLLSSDVGGLARSPKNSASCRLELVGGGPASCDCSLELGQVGSYLPLLQSPVATKRATVPCRRSNPVSDKINPGQQQVNWRGREYD